MRKVAALLALMLVLTPLLLSAASLAQTSPQRITFDFNPTDSVGWGQASSMIPPWSWVTIAANFDGRLLTRPDGTIELTPLTGNLIFAPGTPGEANFTMQLKPNSVFTFTSGPWPGCAVVCHTTIAPAQMKYQGPGSSARDGAGTLSWMSVENLPVAPTTRRTANFWGVVVSKDQGWYINAWDRNTPTIGP